jgi:hypothetical protein
MSLIVTKFLVIWGSILAWPALTTGDLEGAGGKYSFIFCLNVLTI